MATRACAERFLFYPSCTCAVHLFWGHHCVALRSLTLGGRGPPPSEALASRRRVAGVSRSHPTPFSRQTCDLPPSFSVTVCCGPRGNIFMKVRYNHYITCTLLRVTVNHWEYIPQIRYISPLHQPPMTKSHLLKIGDYI